MKTLGLFYTNGAVDEERVALFADLWRETKELLSPHTRERVQTVLNCQTWGAVNPIQTISNVVGDVLNSESA